MHLEEYPVDKQAPIYRFHPRHNTTSWIQYKSKNISSCVCHIFGYFREERKVENLTPNISPKKGSGGPKFFFGDRAQGAYLSSKRGVPPVMGRGRGYFKKLTKKLGVRRGELFSKN